MKLLIELLCPLEYFVSIVQSGRKRKAFCHLPQELGKCEGHRFMYAFSNRQQMCVPFAFSNCGGNENRCFSKENCAKACAQIRSRFVSYI
ncbi:LOW QUALITY PROTEIN: kunitz-type serine protease inhibitor 2 [Drosophila santomea]|uniref:LOW QUALITY PROTEIN: kunitz-type serine protease inhibitor 2 n=1 Tax=Drosophila santomea TaxID=129105 RepID=UPI00195345DF|nr:LOW QUALITY PROTEIN: kunitz-type serine protease inhibitor 2 [Drosophila santomea]